MYSITCLHFLPLVISCISKLIFLTPCIFTQGCLYVAHLHSLKHCHLRWLGISFPSHFPDLAYDTDHCFYFKPWVTSVSAMFSSFRELFKEYWVYIILLQKVSGCSSKSLLPTSVLFGLVSRLEEAVLILKRTQILFVVSWIIACPFLWALILGKPSIWQTKIMRTSPSCHFFGQRRKPWKFPLLKLITSESKI